LIWIDAIGDKDGGTQRFSGGIGTVGLLLDALRLALDCRAVVRIRHARKVLEVERQSLPISGGT
jgi:hypothetical protein